MSSASAQHNTTEEALKWSDPLIELQFRQFEKYVDDRTNQGVAADDVAAAAEYLCEWSRNLLNRAFGRTTADEFDQLTCLFHSTASRIREWASLVTDPAQAKRIRALAIHIEQRTGLQGQETGAVDN